MFYENDLISLRKCKAKKVLRMRKIGKMKNIVTLILLLGIICISNSNVAEPGTLAIAPLMTEAATIERLSLLLKDTKKGDLSFCFGYIKSSKYSNEEIADFISTWSPEAYKRRIPVVFRNKMDRVIGKLRSIDYQQLIIDIDLIKNSSLTIRDIVRIIKGTSLYKYQS